MIMQDGAAGRPSRVDDRRSGCELTEIVREKQVTTGVFKGQQTNS